MNHLTGGITWTCDRIIPRFHDINDIRENNLNKTTRDKIEDIAACTFVLLAGVISFLAFPQLTLAGFVLGHVYRHTIRKEIAGLFNTADKVNLVVKLVFLVAAFASWPYLYLAIPPIIGCYVGWQALDRCAEDNSFFSRSTHPEDVNSADETSQMMS